MLAMSLTVPLYIATNQIRQLEQDFILNLLSFGQYVIISSAMDMPTNFI